MGHRHNGRCMSNKLIFENTFRRVWALKHCQNIYQPHKAIRNSIWLGAHLGVNSNRVGFLNNFKIFIVRKILLIVPKIILSKIDFEGSQEVASPKIILSCHHHQMLDPILSPSTELAGFRMVIVFITPHHVVRSHASSFISPFFFISFSTYRLLQISK